MTNLALLTIIAQLVFLESVLSLDNAAVLGAMVVRLPNDQPVPWPRSLQWLGSRLQRFLGPQQSAALKVGLLGAYLGRAIMVGLASYVIQNPWLRIIGALYLLYLALDYLGDLRTHETKEQTDTQNLTVRTGFWSTVVTLELADVAFSLDNVVAGVALSDNYWIVLLGVVVGMVMMRFAAGIFARMIAWEPALQHSAYLLILAIGIEQLLSDLANIHLGEMTQFAISLAILALTVGFARISWLQPLRICWPPLLTLASLLRLPFRWISSPIRYLIRQMASRRSSAIAPPH